MRSEPPIWHRDVLRVRSHFRSGERGGWTWRVRGAQAYPPGDVHPRRIVAEFMAGESVKKLARQYGVPVSTIENVLRWQFWERENGRKR